MIKQSLYTFLFLVSSFSAFAQFTAPTIKWQKCYGGTGYDEGVRAIQTSDGGYLAIGISQSSDGDVTANNGDIDAWVVKTDSLGKIEWQKSLGSSIAEYGLSAVEANNGGYLISGYKEVIALRKSDYMVIRIDSRGNLVWQKLYGGSNYDKAWNMSKTRDGGYLLIGESYSTDGDATGNHGLRDFWLVKTDSSGNLVWQKSYGGADSDIAYSGQQTPDGGYIVAGKSASTSGDVTGNHGSEDIWVVKTDSLGNLQWQKCYGGTKLENARAIIPLNNGYIIGGNTYSNDGDVTGNHKTDIEDVWVIRTDLNGNIIWQKCFGGTDRDEALGIIKTTDGGFALAAWTATNNKGDVTGFHGSFDYWIVKISQSGALEWQNCFGGSSYEVCSSIQQTADNGFILCGWTDSFNGQVTFNHGDRDYWMIKLGADKSGCSVCPPPTNLLAKVVTKTKVKFTWDTTTCAVKYRIHYRKQGTTTWTDVIVGSNIGWKVVPTLTPNTTYEWYMNTVCIKNPLQKSGGSVKGTFTTPLRLEDESEISNADIILYPNPATNQLTVSCEQLEVGEYEVRIYNLMGQQVKEVKMNMNGEGTFNLNISELPMGYYQLALKGENIMLNKPFIKN